MYRMHMLSTFDNQEYMAAGILAHKSSTIKANLQQFERSGYCHNFIENDKDQFQNFYVLYIYFNF